MKKFIIILLTIVLISAVISPVATAKTTSKQSKDGTQKGPILDKIKDLINNVITFFKNIFGLVEDVENIEPPKEFDKTYKPYYQDEGTEPGSEKPTDTSISVSIKDYNVDYTDNDDTFEFDMTFKGSTSGDVYACYWILVNYYDDGTNAYAKIWMNPIQTKLDMKDYSFELTFTGTGSGGDDDWSTFTAKQYVSGISIDQDEIPFDIPDSNQDKSLKDVRLYVRAFSDKDLTQWNQGSISILTEMTGTMAYLVLKQ